MYDCVWLCMIVHGCACSLVYKPLQEPLIYNKAQNVIGVILHFLGNDGAPTCGNGCWGLKHNKHWVNNLGVGQTMSISTASSSLGLVSPKVESINWKESIFCTMDQHDQKKQRSSGASRRAWNAAKWRHVLFSMVLAVFLCFFHLLVSCHFMFVFLKFWAKIPWQHSFAHVARGYSEMHLFKCWW